MSAPVVAPSPSADGVALIASERRRQVEAEGWTPEHDDEHTGEGLAAAAACYARPPKLRPFAVRECGQTPLIWPWEPKWWKPGDRVRELVKAGALIAAEIDRLQRAAAKQEAQS
jgi:hypothetical protein